MRERTCPRKMRAVRQTAKQKGGGAAKDATVYAAFSAASRFIAAESFITF